MKTVQYPQQMESACIRDQIIRLENSVWATGNPEIDNCFPTQPDTYVTSFLLIDEEKVLSHIAVRRRQLFHKGSCYLAYGLSEVVTHPAFRGQGLGARLLHETGAWIEQQGADLSIFTCQPSLIPFYSKGGW